MLYARTEPTHPASGESCRRFGEFSRPYSRRACRHDNRFRVSPCLNTAHDENVTGKGKGGDLESFANPNRTCLAYRRKRYNYRHSSERATGRAVRPNPRVVLEALSLLLYSS